MVEGWLGGSSDEVEAGVAGAGTAVEAGVELEDSGEGAADGDREGVGEVVSGEGGPS